MHVEAPLTDCTLTEKAIVRLHERYGAHVAALHHAGDLALEPSHWYDALALKDWHEFMMRLWRLHKRQRRERGDYKHDDD